MTDIHDFDAVIIGGGHNALVCAAYLGKFGRRRVLVLEQRDIVGGFASTESPFTSHPEVKISRFGVDHMHMCSGPVPVELELESYRPKNGDPFDYLWHDHAHWLYMYPGNKGILGVKDLDFTVDQVDRAFAGEGSGYREFTLAWHRLIEVIESVDVNPPVPNGLGHFAAWLANCDRMSQFFLGDPVEFIRRFMKRDEMVALQAWWASQTASPPWQPGSSALALSLAAATHLTGKARPRGGSGALSRVLADMVEHEHGGQVKTNALVTEVVVDRGRVRGVRYREHGSERTETVNAPVVVSSADARRLFTRMVSEEYLPGWLKDEVAKIYYSRTGLVKADVLVSKKPDFAAGFGPSPTGNDDDYAVATGIIAPSYEDYLKPGWLDILGGRPAAQPALWCVVNTVLDPSLAPSGLHTLWLSQFTCKELANGGRWSDIKDKVGRDMFRTYARYAGLEESDIVDMVVTTPDDMDEMLCTNDPFGVAMNMDQMLSFRPSSHLSKYRTPIKGLYLTGSGVHPGGGITGVPGRLTALEALADTGGATGSPRRSKLQMTKDLWQAFQKMRRLDF